MKPLPSGRREGRVEWNPDRQAIERGGGVEPLPLGHREGRVEWNPYRQAIERGVGVEWTCHGLTTCTCQHAARSAAARYHDNKTTKQRRTEITFHLPPALLLTACCCRLTLHAAVAALSLIHI